MNIRVAGWFAAVLALVFAYSACAQDKANEKAPFPFQEAPEKKDWKWDEDDRFNELMEQLAINEASLDAVDAAIANKIRKKSGQLGAVKRNDENNRMMDRRGGGPMKWNEFYGTNAEKFFYHPVDPSTSYHTATALRQMGKAEDDKSGSGVPSRQSVPVHQRPPQWDYIYRANRTASESALSDAALLATEVEGLEQRRTQLEQEQAVLWCKLAFRAVQRLDMHRKPVLRFQLVAAGDGKDEVEQAEALSAAAQFLTSVLLIVEKAEEDQSVAMGGAKSVVIEAREKFEDAIAGQPSLEVASTDKESPLGQFAALAKMLGDKSKTLSEVYAGAMDGAANNETARKESYRGMLQRTVIDYAQILLALNELCDVMKKEWRVSVDTKSKVADIDVRWSAPAVADVPRGSPPQISGVGKKPVVKGAQTLSLDPAQLRKKGNWNMEAVGIVSPNNQDSCWIALPVTVGGDYSVSFKATRLGQPYGLNIGLPVATGGHGMVVIDGGKASDVTALEMLDGKGFKDNETKRVGSFLRQGVPVRVDVNVTPAAIRVTLDGHEVIHWKGDQRRLSLHTGWAVPAEVGVFLGSQTSIRFTDVVVRGR